jgi:hypothetical protein
MDYLILQARNGNERTIIPMQAVVSITGNAKHLTIVELTNGSRIESAYESCVESRQPADGVEAWNLLRTGDDTFAWLRYPVQSWVTRRFYPSEFRETKYFEAVGTDSLEQESCAVTILVDRKRRLACEYGEDGWLWTPDVVGLIQAQVSKIPSAAMPEWIAEVACGQTERHSGLKAAES